MFKPLLLRNLVRATQSQTPRTPLLVKQRSVTHTTRPFSSTPSRLSASKDNQTNNATTAASPGENARIDDSITVSYPQVAELPASHPIQGRGGSHYKRTLASFSMEGKVSVITGGARGLGLVMAQALVSSGADVALVDLNVEEAERAAKELLETFKAENSGSENIRIPKITAHYCDVSSPSSVTKSFANIVESHGKVDTLVTSAGFTENFDAISYPHDRLQKLWGVNVDGTYLWSVAVAKHLIERKVGGSIVMIGSMSGSIVNVPQPQAPYNASKAAVRHLASSLAVEWAEKGIRVNCISPGYMLTALTKKILDDNPELERKWTGLIPVGKMGKPEDLMGAVVFLSSDASGYVTGADLRVDGAYTCT